MKINKRKNYKKLYVTGAIALVICALVGAAYFYYFTPLNQRNADNNSSDGAGPAPNRLSDDEAQAKKDFIEKGDDKPSDSPAKASSIEVSAENKPDGVVVLSKLHGFGDGECTLSITNGSRSYTETAKIIYQPEYSTCAGFSVSKSKLGSGTWKITIVAKSTNATKEGTATIAVQ